MPRVEHECVLDHSTSFVWDYLSDLPRSFPEWIFGMAEFAPTGPDSGGLGAGFTGTFRVKPVTLQATGEITAWEEQEVISIRSTAGFQQETTLRLEDTTNGCKLRAAIEYDLPGGMAGKALGAALAPIIGPVLRKSETELRARLDEHRIEA